jgi:acetolactate synthase-1/2/3 large subunit
MPAIVHFLQALLPLDAVLTNSVGNFASWLHSFYRYTGLARGHKTQLAPTNGAMVCGVPAGIAASILTGRTVFTISGDSDFLMNGQELATATKHGAKTTVLLVNNGSFGPIRMHQERARPARVIGSALANPDFCALAQAYGYRAERVRATADFEPVLRCTLAAVRGTVIKLVLDAKVTTTRGTLSAIRCSALKGS